MEIRKVHKYIVRVDFCDFIDSRTRWSKLGSTIKFQFDIRIIEILKMLNAKLILQKMGILDSVEFVQVFYVQKVIENEKKLQP